MSEKIYAWLLRLYPARFRVAFGDEALQLFRDRARDERGFFPRLRLWLDLLADLAVSVPGEYLHVQTAVAGIQAHSGSSGVPSFNLLRRESPALGALLLGSVLSAGFLCVFSFWISQVGRGPQPGVVAAPPRNSADEPSYALNDGDMRSSDEIQNEAGEEIGSSQPPVVQPRNSKPGEMQLGDLPSLSLLLVDGSWPPQAERSKTNESAKNHVCSPVPGAEQIWSNLRLRWVLIGGGHGDNETPAVFFNLVCDALARGKQVTVALEFPSNDQTALDDILSASDLASSGKILLSQASWKYGMDGRASEAMLRLLVSLRELHRSYPGLEVGAFDVPFASNMAPGARQQAIGRNLLALARAKADRLILVLAGDLLAVEERRFGHDTAAMYLPARERLSLEVTDRGGESWVRSPEGCGPMKADGQGGRVPYGVSLKPNLAPDGKFDGVLALGVVLTPSPPAAGIPTPLPACRSQYLSAR